MLNHETVITSRDGISRHRFCYDHCFWSFDDVTAPFADQKTVYTNLAQPLLDKAFQGYNTCLFAYGQVSVMFVIYRRCWCVSFVASFLLFFYLL